MILHQAIDWHIRQRDLDVDGWDAFATWLEADAAHRAAYDQISMADDRRGALLPANDADIDDARNRRRRWAIGGGAMAAVAAGLLVLLPAKQTSPASTEIAAASTAPRSVPFADGTRIDLTPASRIELDKGDKRHARLANGTALFTIRHDPDHPFELRLGNHMARDVGTVFEASLVNGIIDIAVSEGGVVFDPDVSAIRITPGQRLRFDTRRSIANLSTIPTASVGAWRQGHLDFADAPIAMAVDALGRATGAEIRLSPALQGHRFTGIVKLTGNATQDIPRFADLTGTVSKKDGNYWVIVPEAGER
jgi:transmembrane sensor